MSMLTLYFLLKLDAIIGLFIGILVASVIFTIVYMTVRATQIVDYSTASKEEDDWRKYRQFIIKKCIPVILVIIIITIAIPNTKEMAFIYVASKVTQSNRAKRIGEKALDMPEKALDILNKKMNEYLEDQIKNKTEK